MTPAKDRTYVYAIHIAASRDRVWEALTNDVFIRQYWPEWRFETDWKAGSNLRYYWAENGKLYSEGEVLESDPPKKLVFTWPEHDAKPDALPELLTWEISQFSPSVSLLKLTHERLTEEWYQGVSTGWPMIISSIKTLLETGKPLPLDERPKPEFEF
jgi:uncharacterized protein YndB with AHSA1/START domain